MTDDIEPSLPGTLCKGFKILLGKAQTASIKIRVDIRPRLFQTTVKPGNFSAHIQIVNRRNQIIISIKRRFRIKLVLKASENVDLTGVLRL